MEKPIVYADRPEYNEETEYLMQKEPVDMGDHIFIDYEVGMVAVTEGRPEIQQSEYIPCVPALSLEERVGTVEVKTVTLEEAIDAIFGGV